MEAENESIINNKGKIMKFWLKLASVEWFRSILWGKYSKPDFFWLTVLLALTLSLAILIYGSREGLLNQFMDVSLGNIEQAGIPIWVVARIDEQGRVIDRELLEKIKAKEFNIRPSRLVEWDEVALPKTMDGKTPLWGAKHIPFKGWAVSKQDPLWKNNVSSSAKHTELPLEVILSRSLFREYFQCAKYEAALEAALEEKKRSDFTKSHSVPGDNKLYCLTDKLWLDVRTRRGRELLPFRIHWVEGRIPTMDELGFLFPMSTLYALRIAKHYPNIKYYPEAEGKATKRIKKLILWQDEEDDTLRENLASCLIAKPAREETKNQIVPKRPLPLEWVEQCAKRQGIPLQKSPDQYLVEPYLDIAEPIEGHRFRYENDYLTLLCEADNPDCQPCEETVYAWKKYTKKGFVTCNKTEVTADMLAMIGGYDQAFIYVKERRSIFDHLAEIKAITRTPTDSPALSIHPTYDNALVRLDFMDKVMQLLDSEYTLFFLLFIVVLLFVQIGIVIQHREHDYGIFLAKGMSWIQLHLMVYSQILLSFFLAIVGTMVAISWVRDKLASELSLITKLYEANIQVGDLELLPLLWGEYMRVSAVILGVAFFMAMLFLILKQKRFGQEAAHFFK